MTIKTNTLLRPGERIGLVRKIAKMGRIYLITLPPEVGKKLHRKSVLVEITPLDT